MSRFWTGFVSVVLCSMTAVAIAGEADPGYLSTIGADGKRVSIGTVRAAAHVTASDGLEFDVVTVFHDHQRAIFQQAYESGTATVGIDGKYYWIFDGEIEAEGAQIHEAIVLGHQFHAQLLFFDELNGPLGAASEGEFDGRPCLSYTGPSGHSLHVDAKTRLPVALVWIREGAADVKTTFDDWRKVDGIDLPFVATIDDGERTFTYRFSSVTFNEGYIGEFRVPVRLLNDEQKLLRRHRIAMDAHFFGDAGMMKGNFGAVGVVASRGEIYGTDGPGAEAMMELLLSDRDYTRYDDLVRPIVRISDDGSLGWVVVQVLAEGVRFDANGKPSTPLEFTSAWISMFEKVDGEWKQIGNVSNFKPGLR